MDQKYESLFTPFSIGNCEIKNRIVLEPMGGTSMISMLDNSYDEKLHDYFIDKAKNDVGLIIPGITMIKPVLGGWLYQFPEGFKNVRPLIDEIHSYGAKVFFQLTAGLGRAMPLSPAMMEMMQNMPAGAPTINVGDLLVSADQGAPDKWMPEVKVRALTVDEIHEYVDAYAKVALLCKEEAGVDGVEIHAVHEGYLLDQFTTKYTNHRTDEYGGSLENRYRFPAEVVRAIKDLCGEDFPVSLRYSVTSKTKGFNQGAVPGEDYVEAGRDMEESEWAIKFLEEAGYDSFNCDNGTYDAWYWAHPPVYMPLNCNLEDVTHIKNYTTKPVICAGRMEPDTAAASIAAGDIDAMGVARQFLCDTEWVTKIEEGREEDIRPCISCQTGCFAMGTYKGAGAVVDFQNASTILSHCALNPRTLEESKYPVIQAENPKHIAVVGGGIGGMEVAIQSAKRGHSVDLYEKTDQLGGVFISATTPSFKEKDKELVEWYRREVKKYPEISIHVNTEITSIDELDADEIVLATGAEPKKLPIPGFDKTVEAMDYLLGNKEVGETVAVIGGGLTGCEIAYNLVLEGKKPFIVEMLNDLVVGVGICAANSQLLRDYLAYYKVPVYLESSLKEVKDGSVVISTPEGEKEIACDSTIASVGYNPAPTIAPESEHVHIIGDAAKVGNLKSVIWAANDLVMTF